MKKIVAYYPEWGIYPGHDYYKPEDISWEQITHLNYAFADINKSTNELQLFDAYAAEQNLPKLVELNKQYPHVKTLISVGGWSRSDGFHNAALTPQSRETFANSCVKFVRDWEFAGVDIDWEYPTFVRQGDTVDNPNDLGTPAADANEAFTFPELLKTIREKLDEAGAQDNKYYLLTCAVALNANLIHATRPDLFAPHLDFINVMSYDAHGAFEPITGHHSPLFSNPYEPYDEFTKQYFNTAAALDVYKSYGISSEKLVLGVPFYSRGWGEVSKQFPIENKMHEGKLISLPGLFANAVIESVKGKWDGGRNAGVNPYDYIEEVMLAPGSTFTKYRDPWAKVPYIYSSVKNEMYSYEDVISVREKMKYVNEHNYAGAILWDLTGDKTNNLLTAMNEELFGTSTAIGEATLKFNLTGNSYDFTPKVTIGNTTYDIAFNQTVSISVPTGSYRVEVWAARTKDYKTLYVPNVTPKFVDLINGDVAQVDISYTMQAGEQTATTINASATIVETANYGGTFQYKITLKNQDEVEIPKGWNLAFEMQDSSASLGSTYTGSIVKNQNSYVLSDSAWANAGIAAGNNANFTGDGTGLLTNANKPKKYYLNGQRIGVVGEKIIVLDSGVNPTTGSIKVLVENANYSFVPKITIDNKTYNIAFGQSNVISELIPGDYIVHVASHEDENFDYIPQTIPASVVVVAGQNVNVNVKYDAVPKDEIIVPPDGKGSIEIRVKDADYPFVPVITINNTIYNVQFGSNYVFDNLDFGTYSIGANTVMNNGFTYTPEVIPNKVDLNACKPNKIVEINYIRTGSGNVELEDGKVEISVANANYPFVPQIIIDGKTNTINFGETKIIEISNEGIYQISANSFEDEDYMYTPLITPTSANIVSGETETITVSYKATQKQPTTGNISLETMITSDWGTGYNFDMTISNNTAFTITNWVFDCDFDDTITGIWNAGSYVANGNHYTVNHAAWDSDIAPGQKVSFGGGATRVVDRAKPYNAKVNGRLIDGGEVGPEPTLGHVEILVVGNDYGIDTSVTFNAQIYNRIRYNEPLLISNLIAGMYSISATTQKDSEFIYTPVITPSPVRVSDNVTTQVRISYNKTALPSESGEYPDYSNVDVGVGKAWGDRFFSPFVDATIWFNKGGYSGLYPIFDESAQSDAKLVNLGFIVADNNDQPSWGNFYDIAGNDPDTGFAIRNMFSQIKKLRQAGGDVLVSFGGENGMPLHIVVKDENVLAQHYIRFVNAFGLKNIDFDIEGFATRDKQSWQRNNAAIKIMQDELGANAPEVWFTFPTLPSGLVGEGTGDDCYNILLDAVQKGVVVRGVNIMTMCFGISAVPDPSDMSVPVIQASEALKAQIMKIYQTAGKPITAEQAYKMVGITPMIGVSYQPQEIFNQDNAQTVLDYAISKNIGMLSYWALTRDKTGNGSLADGTMIAQQEYAFAQAWKNYTNN